MHILRFVFILVFFLPIAAQAHVPLVVAPESADELIAIDDLKTSQAFYGAMHGFPHTYVLTADTDTELSLKILVPETNSPSNNISGIVIKQNPHGGRVIEIARFDPTDASWESFYEPFGGDRYQRGPVFAGPIEAGVYHVQIYTADNTEKYVLVVGDVERWNLGYLESVRRIAAVKEFFGKSPWAVIESPFVYVPLTLLVVAGIFVWWWRFWKTS